MLRYSKFLLRRLAYVPWLLAVGLVLGGAEEAAAQTPVLTVYPGYASEGSIMEFTVVLSPQSTETVTVQWNAAVTQSGDNLAESSDFKATSGTLTFYAGQSTQTVFVETTQDIKHEDNETFTLTLTGVLPATLSIANPPPETGTILDDDDPPSLSVAAASGTEGGPVDFTVSLSPVSGQAVTVNYATAFGTATRADFTATSGALTIAAGASSGTVSVTTINDLLNEEDETFTLTLSNPSAPATLGTATATGTIKDDVSDDAITLTVNPSSVARTRG